MRRFSALALAAALVVVGGAGASHGIADSEVTEGSADGVMLQNKQNEPTVAINPVAPTQIAGGANDNIDLEACNLGDDTTCPFTAGVGVTGISFLSSDGVTWNQPDYTGFSKRHCLGDPNSNTDTCDARTSSTTPPGLIGTVPWYFENGLSSDGDPVLVFGPRPRPNGFSWANGARLYYSNLTSNIFASRNEALKGFEGIGVSRTDNVPLAATGGAAGKAAWMPPVIASKQGGASFSDKEEMIADDAASSPFFGSVYVCYTAFGSVGGPPEPIEVSRSRDGGDTWATTKISPSANTGTGQGRQGCNVKTDSGGVVYVTWRGGQFGDKEEPPIANRVVFLSRSFDGGVSFEKPRPIADIQECGLFDPNQGRSSFDGAAGSRTSSFPILDIANGAPNGFPQPHNDVLVLTWCDGPTTTTGFGDEALIQVSIDKGQTWSTPVDAAPAGHRPDFPGVGISPDGTDVYFTYMNFLQPWQTTTANPRLMNGVVRHANLNPATGALGAFTTVHTGATGDARGSATNSLVAEFLGDYNYVAATKDFAYAVWNDVRNATNCPAIDTFRQKLLTGTTPNPTPEPQQDCPPKNGKVFGNSDIFGTRILDPTP